MELKYNVKQLQGTLCLDGCFYLIPGSFEALQARADKMTEEAASGSDACFTWMQSFRLSFPHLFLLRSRKPGFSCSYSVTFPFDSTLKILYWIVLWFE